jgi:hypothetical protein
VLSASEASKLLSSQAPKDSRMSAFSALRGIRWPAASANPTTLSQA